LHTPALWHWSVAVQATGVPAQVPFVQLSPEVQGLPSLQAVPLVAAGLLQTPVAGLQVPATWHWSLAVQVIGLLPLHAPARQVSVCVHALPSLQAVPSMAFEYEQVPFAGLQVPTWHITAAQTTGLVPVQVPLWQVSVCVHALPSLQAVPPGALGFEQVPVVELHAPAMWHWSSAVQTTGLPPWQVPVRQVEFRMHRSEFVQEVPSAASGFEQSPVPALQTPATWHWSSAVQMIPVHLLPWFRNPTVPSGPEQPVAASAARPTDTARTAGKPDLGGTR
jgi:hypothetical protein